MSVPLSSIDSPAFVLDQTLLEQNLSILKQVQEASGVTIILALKGFSMFSAFPFIQKHFVGTTASSLNEARLAYEEFGGEVHAYCVAYHPDEFVEMMRYSKHITFNSLAQYTQFYPQVLFSGKKISCGLRINPEYSEVETDLYNPCIPGSRLGITREHFGDILPSGVDGLHFHNLCEKDSYALERTLIEIEKKFDSLLHQCKWVNFGGGHLITKEGYDTGHLIKVIKRFKEKYQVEVILEPGAAFAWRTGYLIATVLDQVSSGGQDVAILDISVSAHMPDCIEMPYIPVVQGARQAEGTEKGIKIGGQTCLAGDYIGNYVFENGLKIGDKLVFEDMMHYTMVKTTMFNGVRHPDIGIIDLGGVYHKVRTFGYEDFKSRLG